MRLLRHRGGCEDAGRARAARRRLRPRGALVKGRRARSGEPRGLLQALQRQEECPHTAARDHGEAGAAAGRIRLLFARQQFPPWKMRTSYTRNAARRLRGGSAPQRQGCPSRHLVVDRRMKDDLLRDWARARRAKPTDVPDHEATKSTPVSEDDLAGALAELTAKS